MFLFLIFTNQINKQRVRRSFDFKNQFHLLILFIFKHSDFKDYIWYESGGAVFAYEHYTFRKQVFLVESFKPDVEKKKEISQIVKEDRGLEKDIDQVKNSKKIFHVKTIKR